MNDRAPDSSSLQSTPTTRPRPDGLRAKRSSAGASRAQGPHQLAQKTTSTGRPPAALSRLASVTRGPARPSRGSPGAKRPREDERSEASPKTTRAASPAAPTSVQASSRRRRDIERRSACGQQGRLAGDAGGAELGDAGTHDPRSSTRESRPCPNITQRSYQALLVARTRCRRQKQLQTSSSYASCSEIC
jgi:hypothetical protein